MIFGVGQFANRAFASKKQTPFSVWYPPGADSRQSRSTRLKEADAFQRLVYVHLRRVWREVQLPQRSRRLSASGMNENLAHLLEFLVASKKQTPFSVWYFYLSA